VRPQNPESVQPNDDQDHVLPDVLAQGLRIVFCGTAAGTESARQRAYYAHPQNRFWRVLHEAGLTPRRLAPVEYSMLPDFGLGLTDIAKFASGMDSQLPRGALGRAPCELLFAKIALAAPRILAFTSLTAGRRYLGRGDAGYGLQPEKILLPSPSPTANWKWDRAPWLDLANAAQLVGAEAHAPT
jgi:double-stranded uracil-DNA glycosylase